MLAALLLCAPPALAQQDKPRVMIVGVAHLVARRDVHNSGFVDDPLSGRRQQQIADVVRRLARFAPTKVLIEAPEGGAVYDKRYHDYLAGKYALERDEVDQFGFRLARISNDADVYPVDTFGPQLLDGNSPAGKRVDLFLTENLKTVKGAAFDRFLARSDELERTGTYLELLRYLNSDDAIRANAGWYSVVAGMGRDASMAGASYVAQWYVRNTYIFSNILSVLSPGDRAVVLFGQGHEYLLREFVRLNPDLEDVDPLTYLS